MAEQVAFQGDGPGFRGVSDHKQSIPAFFSFSHLVLGQAWGLQ